MKGLYCLIDTDIRKLVSIPKDLMERYGTYNEYVALEYLKLKPNLDFSSLPLMHHLPDLL